MSAHTNRSSSRPSPSPNSAVAWIQEDSQGNRWVYYRLSSGGFSAGEKLPSTGGQQGLSAAASPCPNGIWTGFCWICP